LARKILVKAIKKRRKSLVVITVIMITKKNRNPTRSRTMYQFPEKRSHARHDRLDLVFVSDQQQSFIKVILLNYSQTGIYIKASCHLPPGQTICIKAAESLKDRMPATCYGKVVWCSPVISRHPHFRAGIKFTPQKPETAA
jgi:hypothetical protein